MRLVQLTMHNWLCYDGTTVLKFDEKAYAIVAQRANDAGSSNWGGKSGVVEAIGFALFGTHRWDTEDQWITNGKPDGHVHLLFSDGTNVKRSRVRGKRTEVGYYDTATNTRADQDEAQKAIVRWLGVDAEMFKATSFFEQKKMSRLILATPKQRMDIVSAWLDLEKIQACEVKAKLFAADYTTTSDTLALQLKHASDMHEVRSIQFQKYEDEGGMVGMRERDSVLNDHLADLDAAIASASAERTEYEHVKRIYEDAVSKRDALKKELATLPKVDLEAMAEWEADRDALASRFDELERTTARLALLKMGGFDGSCPVSRGFVCPAKDTLNARRTEAEAEFESIREERGRVYDELREVNEGLRQAKRIVIRRQEIEHQLTPLFETIASVKDAYAKAMTKTPTDTAEAISKRDAYREEWKVLQGDMRVMKDLYKQLEDGREQIATLTKKFKEASTKATLYQQAMVIFGRNGAQRRIAEAALGQIEGLANQLLQDAGIALSVAVRWSREGDGLASSCDKCGSAYPTSAKVKQCSNCNARRGQNLVNKLEILLSNRSGAAEDLAGVAIQLAASRWLRAERGSQVEFAVLDEPFGALDRTNRKALSTALPKMLASAGIHQAFVIAHTADVLDALPARIAITSTDGCATASVEG